MTSEPSTTHLDEFTELMEKLHERLGVKKGKYMLTEAELGEIWDAFAQSVQNMLNGANPTEIQTRSVQVANNCAYIYELMERQNKTTFASKLLQERKQRLKALEGRTVA